MINWRLTLAVLGVVAFAAAPTASAAEAARTDQTALAQLFGATAQVELQEHFAEFAVLAGLVGSNEANLQDAISGETQEATTIYPGFAKQATADNCAAAANLFTEIAGDEAGHAAAFTRALQVLTAGTPQAGAAEVAAATPQVTAVEITAGAPACTGQTQANLETAMRGEAFAYAKYTAYAAEAARH